MELTHQLVCYSSRELEPRACRNMSAAPEVTRLVLGCSFPWYELALALEFPSIGTKSYTFRELQSACGAFSCILLIFCRLFMYELGPLTAPNISRF